MAFEFKKKERKGVGSKLDDKEMAERIKREAERFTDATDSEYWTCLCFRTDEERSRFVRITGIPDRKFVTGEEMRDHLAPFKPETVKRGFPRTPRSTVKTPNPLAGVDYNQSLEKSSYDEAMALKAALMSARAPRPLGEVTDTDVWICTVFKNRKDSEDFLTAWNLHKHGDKYLDASSWLKELESRA